MNKINYFLKRAVVWFRKHYYWSTSISLLIILLILLLPILRSSWLFYPESLKIRISLKKFINSFEEYKYCREDCAAVRSFYADVIKKALMSNNISYAAVMQKEIFNSNISTETRSELLKLYKTTASSAPQEIKNFYINSQNNFMTRAALAETWPELNNNSFISEIIGRYKNSASVKERLELLDLLNEKNGDLITSLLWEIILGSDGKDLKSKAFLLLANIDRKDLAYKIEDLDNIKLVLNDNSYESRLKDLAIWLLSDYYQYFPIPSENILLLVASGQQFDNYQKTFAINILNYQKSANLKLPELSQADWNSYYNN